MSDQNSESIIYIEQDVVIGEVTISFWGTVKSVTFNGKKHTAIIGESRVLFLSEDSLGKSKIFLAKAAMSVTSFMLGVHSMGRVSKLFLADEGFDIFGSREISFRYFPVDTSDEETTMICDYVMNNIVIRRKYDEEPNDFTDFPAPQIALKFQSHERAVAFANALQSAQEAWRNRPCR